MFCFWWDEACQTGNKLGIISVPLQGRAARYAIIVTGSFTQYGYPRVMKWIKKT